MVQLANQACGDRELGLRKQSTWVKALSLFTVNTQWSFDFLAVFAFLVGFAVAFCLLARI